MDTPMVRSASERASWSELAFHFSVLGVTAFGGPAAHIGLFADLFNLHFASLLALGQCLPGPTSTQMSFALGMSQQGPLAGLMTGLLFLMPGALTMTAFGYGASFLDSLSVPGTPLNCAGAGLSAVGVAMIAGASLGLCQKLCTDRVTSTIAGVTCAACVALPAAWLYPAALVAGGALTLALASLPAGRGGASRESKSELAESLRASLSSADGAAVSPEAERDVPEPAKQNSLTGMGESGGVGRVAGAGLLLPELPAVKGLVEWAAAPPQSQPPLSRSFLGLPDLPALGGGGESRAEGPPSPPPPTPAATLLYLFSRLAIIGALVYGGGPIVLPMIQLSLVDEAGLLTEHQFLAGLGVSQAMPGPALQCGGGSAGRAGSHTSGVHRPNFNIAAYLGAQAATTAGAAPLLGSLACWLGIFTPGVLLIFGVMPFAEAVWAASWYKRLLPGVNAAAVGIIGSSVFTMYAKTLVNSPFPAYSTGIAILGFVGVRVLQVLAPFVVIAGGLAGWALHYALNVEVGGTAES
ncbi:hypothetical protein EMIHUDRAFT_251320 [Emiliania huxleyi CCMP1516]|uniref:Chromate transporter n=2 Tax=Emiliania huxleyi TaxID=2903 RepID=A0A0D3KWC1_EMIH1|nr:hypothetical protein EMIHUDRAFT_251320 [Emiliania huxleyi CCMP1516]EOD40056.1 hypothetical protein EMIHUDRAFT_251320 [Emiliania huxleyi CCMP1516]|eukprot:XP_005792485.1 hypothetical protein EMIHUDRAFT_251320 [Emiliania huxleyi CCMP1516]